MYVCQDVFEPAQAADRDSDTDLRHRATKRLRNSSPGLQDSEHSQTQDAPSQLPRSSLERVQRVLSGQREPKEKDILKFR